MISSSDSFVETGGTLDDTSSVQNDEHSKLLQLRGIKEPGNNDVLTGRGGGTNFHKGNIRYRKMVDEKKAAYRDLNRVDKSNFGMKFVRDWRSQGGRFLKLVEGTKLWEDIGDEEARIKVSQALREKRLSKIVSGPIYDSHLSPAAVQRSIEKVDALTQLVHKSHQPRRATLGNAAFSTEPRVQVTDEKRTSRVATTQKNSAFLVECLLAIGINSFSRLSGTIVNEFQTIKTAYFQMMLCVHPDSQQGNSAHNSFSRANAAFEVLRSMFHKIRAQRSTFCRFLNVAEENNDLGYIYDLYTHSNSTCYGNVPPPPYEHFALAARHERPTIFVEVSPAQMCAKCTKCNKAILPGDIRVGSVCGWQHMNCWSVPLDVWLGLTQSRDLVATRKDVASMDEIFMCGFTILDYASQLEFVRYVMKRGNWDVARASKSLISLGSDGDLISRGEAVGIERRAMPSLGKEKDVTQKRSFVNMEERDPKYLARPLKKRAVDDESIGLEEHSKINCHSVCRTLGIGA